MKIKLLLVCVLACVSAWAQSRTVINVDLLNVQKLDASTATSTKPMTTVTTAPSGACTDKGAMQQVLIPGAPEQWACTPSSGTACPCVWTKSTGSGSGVASVTAADGTMTVSGTSAISVAVNPLQTATHDSIHQNQQRYFAPTSGSATTYAGTMGACPSSYYTGMVIDFKPDATNTGAATVNVCTLGAKSVKASDGSAALTAGALVSGKIYSIWYDGTNFRMPPRSYDKASWGFCAATNCVAGDAVAIPYIAATASTINKCFIAAGTAPTGASLIVDVLKNGTSIFGGGTKLVLAAAATSGTQSTFATTALAEGDVLTATITQVGSTITGKDIGVVCRLGL